MVAAPRPAAGQDDPVTLARDALRAGNHAEAQYFALQAGLVAGKHFEGEDTDPFTDAPDLSMRWRNGRRTALAAEQERFARVQSGQVSIFTPKPILETST